MAGMVVHAATLGLKAAIVWVWFASLSTILPLHEGFSCEGLTRYVRSQVLGGCLLARVIQRCGPRTRGGNQERNRVEKDKGPHPV